MTPNSPEPNSLVDFALKSDFHEVGPVVVRIQDFEGVDFSRMGERAVITPGGEGCEKEGRFTRCLSLYRDTQLDRPVVYFGLSMPQGQSGNSDRWEDLLWDVWKVAIEERAAEHGDVEFDVYRNRDGASTFCYLIFPPRSLDIAGMLRYGYSLTRELMANPSEFIRQDLQDL